MNTSVQDVVNQEIVVDFVTQSALFCVYLEELEQPKKSDFIEKMLTLLANEGEDKMIKELKKVLKNNKGLEANY